MLKTTEQHLIVHSGLSEAEVTNNKRLWSVVLKLITNKHKSSRGRSVMPELFV